MRYLLCFVLVGCFTTLVRAEDYCSLVVKVFTEPGTEEIGPVPVVVEEQNGRTHRKRYAYGGVSFCDLGILPVTVTVEAPYCNEYVVRHVPVIWGETHTLSIVQDLQLCSRGELGNEPLPPLPGCYFLLRFVNSQQKAIAAVSLQVRSPRPTTRESDGFGRVFLSLPRLEELLATASAKGYDPVDVSLRCGAEIRSEKYITMNEAR